MSRRTDLAARAYREALKLRSRTNRPTNVRVCPFDLADEIGLEVRFADIASLEAVYVDDGAPKILIAADRPAGRQRFSCAHEIGHHVFGHGTHVSCIGLTQTDSRRLNEDEFIANAFASFLLLPKAAVTHTFALRGWNPRHGAPEQFYVVAGLLGVSFDGLITHCVALRLLGRKEASALRTVRLPQLRARIAGRSVSGNLVVVDVPGLETAIDLTVGDHLHAPPNWEPVNNALTIDGQSPAGTLIRAHRPGLSGIRVAPEGNIGIVRIAPVGYVGRAVFRHLEDPDYV